MSNSFLLKKALYGLELKNSLKIVLLYGLGAYSRYMHIHSIDCVRHSQVGAHIYYFIGLIGAAAAADPAIIHLHMFRWYFY